MDVVLGCAYELKQHMAAELRRASRTTVVLAMHPGEVDTDMAKDVELPWEVEGVIGSQESVRGMVQVIGSKGGRVEESGTFWTWEGVEYPW